MKNTQIVGLMIAPFCKKVLNTAPRMGLATIINAPAAKTIVEFWENFRKKPPVHRVVCNIGRVAVTLASFFGNRYSLR